MLGIRDVRANHTYLIRSPISPKSVRLKVDPSASACGKLAGQPVLLPPNSGWYVVAPHPACPRPCRASEESIHGDTFSISALHLAIKVPYLSDSGHKNEKVTQRSPRRPFFRPARQEEVAPSLGTPAEPPHPPSPPMLWPFSSTVMRPTKSLARSRGRAVGSHMVALCTLELRYQHGGPGGGGGIASIVRQATTLVPARSRVGTVRRTPPQRLYGFLPPHGGVRKFRHLGPTSPM
eukprot:SAG31_NODE_1507_length_8072_cov_7.986580_3_plen_235_part_00